MKHTLIYMIAVLTLLSVTSCNRNESRLFDQSADERLQARAEAIHDKLVDAPNGWEMLYFPYPDAAGYAFLMKFQDNGDVVIAAKNTVSSENILRSESSCWAIDATQSVVLTFHTYNTLFSIFADPQGDGIGENGDYEFILLNAEDGEDYIRMKGKKHEAYMRMNQLAEDVDWRQYLLDIDALRAKTFTDNDGTEMIYWDGANEKTLKYSDGRFIFKENKEEVERGFILTPSGMHFYSGLLRADQKTYAQDFVLVDEEDRTLLKTEDGEAWIGSKYTAADFFAYKFTKYSRWMYVAEDSDAETQAAVQAILDAAKANGATINNIGYERVTTVTSRSGQEVRNYTYAMYISYLAEGKQFGGRINLNHSNKDDVLTFSYKSYEEPLLPLFARIADTPADAAARFTDAFCGTFRPESYCGSTLNLTQLLLKDADGTTIHVKADKIVM